MACLDFWSEILFGFVLVEIPLFSIIQKFFGLQSKKVCLDATLTVEQVIYFYKKSSSFVANIDPIDLFSNPKFGPFSRSKS